MSQGESSAGFEERMPPLGVNVEDCRDEDDAQHFSLDELAVADAPQKSLPDVSPIDSLERDIEEKQVDELHDEGELPNTGLVSNETRAELYEGLRQSSFNPVVEKDASEIVPLEREFKVEKCVMGNEPLDDDCWIGGKKEMDKEGELSKESV